MPEQRLNESRALHGSLMARKQQRRQAPCSEPSRRWWLVGALLLGSTLGGCSEDGDDYNGDPSHPEGIGNACVSNADCPTNNCYLGPAGGYCTSDCQDEGSTAQCPIDTVCKPIQGGARRCLLICGTDHYCPAGTTCHDTWCPSGSSCVAVANTDVRACEPDPG